MSKVDATIRAICEHEPMREGEVPASYVVGVRLNSRSNLIVRAIRFREDNYGDHGIGWFDIYVTLDSDSPTLFASVAARAVAVVNYDMVPSQ